MTSRKRQGWRAAGFSTAAEIVAEQSAGSTALYVQSVLRLEGYSIQRGTSVASTVPATLQSGPSSNGPISSSPIGTPGAPLDKVVSGLSIEAGWFAIHAGTTCASGTVAEIWGTWS